MIEWKKGDKLQLSEHFSSSEFECKCGACGDQKISRELLSKLEHVRDVVGKPLRVHSGYRCPEHNIKVGGHPSSSHCMGLAADISIDDLDKLYNACTDEFDNIGDGRNKGFIHIDTRSKRPDGKKRLWLY